MKKIFLFIFILLSASSYAYELDTSIDSEIRKKYNVEELNEKNADKIQLPKLPDLPSEDISTVPNLPNSPSKQVNYTTLSENYSGATKTLKSGARFLVANSKNLSDSLPEGTVVTFYSLESTERKGITIPQGTAFRGKVVKSHTPQITGNGGLIGLEIDGIIYNKTLSKVSAVISKADDKRIFNGKIKGKRQYWKNVKKANNFGIKTNKKMVKAAKKVEKVPVLGLLGIVPRATGAIVLVGNGIVSPFISVFRKGAHATIPRGTIFEIKLTSDVKLKA